MGEQVYESGLDEKHLTTICNALCFYEAKFNTTEMTQHIEEIIGILYKITI